MVFPLVITYIKYVWQYHLKEKVNLVVQTRFFRICHK